MSPRVSQNRLISKLNQYLQYHNLPLRMEKARMCNGLAALYSKYALEGKEDQFQEILENIVKIKPNSKIEIELNQPQ